MALMKTVGWEGINWRDRQVAGFCEYGNEVLCSIKCKEFVDYLRNCLLLKEGLFLLELVMVTCGWLVGCATKMCDV
jgi:hypothetical protein